MNPALIKCTAITLLLCSIFTGTYAIIPLNLRVRRNSNVGYYDDNQLDVPTDGQGQYVNGDLLDAILSRPTKRQWCRKGMTYNHVLGTCTLSFAAIRGRVRGY